MVDQNNVVSLLHFYDSQIIPVSRGLFSTLQGMPLRESFQQMELFALSSLIDTSAEAIQNHIKRYSQEHRIDDIAYAADCEMVRRNIGRWKIRFITHVNSRMSPTDSKNPFAATDIFLQPSARLVTFPNTLAYVSLQGREDLQSLDLIYGIRRL